MVKLTLEISVLFEFAFLRLDEFKAFGAELLLSLGLGSMSSWFLILGLLFLSSWVFVSLSFFDFFL